MIRPTRGHRPLLLAVLLWAATPAAAQNVVLDQGEFALFIGDREVGTETFTIRRTGSGSDAKILANAVVDMGDTEMRPVLETGSDLAPLLYQNEVTGADGSDVAISAAGRRFVARIRSAAGEREREFRATQGAVFLDRQVAHQYYFLAAAADREGAAIPVIVPRTGEQIRLTVTGIGTETLSIGGEQVPARRVRLEGEGTTHTIWFGEQGRVLRVVLPDVGYRAERRSL